MPDDNAPASSVEDSRASTAINDWDETARLGRCQKHNDVAWLHSDGSVTCMFCLTVETSSVHCTVAPLPPAWLERRVGNGSKGTR